MADSAAMPGLAATAKSAKAVSRHSATVRITHWIAALCFAALAVTGVEILISHPRFYWGETGNSSGPALFQIPIPASRAGVPTGYGYVLPDQNGWSRALHFQAAWIVVFCGLAYGIHGLLSGHFRKSLLPVRGDLSWRVISSEIAQHLRFKPSVGAGGGYNVLQRLSYVVVVFVLFPLMIWTGLAMSPAFTAAFPTTVTALGGQQSARTIHFFVFLALALFLIVHVAMVCLTGFRNQMRGMITGRAETEEKSR